ncbi:hypothetical protein EDD18DRAFT_1353611 [Armillaria luteobubalina]|uniref:DUF5648 domain-containing protein n=1 Tax=Armillaria luteobubalina TaxID=153913 RepID=A0AA39Q4A4_9AGAR|nr:hypothetical protein EDD18DRAFT_1353611 [Armillaria luteobubalina]
MSCFAVLLSLGAISAVENATTCPKDTAVPLLRAYLREPYYDHFYTTNAAEMQRAVTTLHYKAEGQTGLVFGFQAPVLSHIPPHWLGYKDEGIVGYIYPKEMCCSVPLYRLYHDKPVRDHLYTEDSKEIDSAKRLGYTYEGIAGYILPVGSWYVGFVQLAAG